jgi:hypothetical protein
MAYKFETSFDTKINDTGDFESIKLCEKVKVSKCTFYSKLNYSESHRNFEKNFFLCECTGEDFYPICSPCVSACHSNHNTISLPLEENFTCMCGKYDHNIKSSQNNLPSKNFMHKISFNKSSTKSYKDLYNSMSKCPFSLLNNIDTGEELTNLNSLNSLYISGKNDRIYCKLCIDHCLVEDFKEEYSPVLHDEKKYCQCIEHSSLNILNLTRDYDKKSLSKYFLNFNFNILATNSKTYEKFFEMFIKKVKDVYNENNSKDKEYDFFTNIYVKDFLQLFSNYKKYYKEINPFFLINKVDEEEHLNNNEYFSEKTEFNKENYKESEI